MADLADQAKNTGSRMRASAAKLIEPSFLGVGKEVAAKKRTQPGDAQQANAMEENKRGDSGAEPTPYAKGGSVRKFAEGGNVKGEAAYDRTGAKRPAVTYKKGGKVHGDEAEDKSLFKKMFKSEEAKEGPEKLAKGGSPKAKKSAPKKVRPKMPPPVMPPDMGAAPPPDMGAGPPMGAPPPMAGAGAPPPQGFAKGGKMNLKLKKGALHSELGVPQGEKIPKAKIASAANSSNPVLKKRAVFAENAAKWKHAEGGNIRRLAEGGSSSGGKQGSDDGSPPPKAPDRKGQKWFMGDEGRDPATAKAVLDDARAKGQLDMKRGGSAQKFALGGVAKIRHDEATSAGKQKPSKGSGWNAYK